MKKLILIGVVSLLLGFTGIAMSGQKNTHNPNAYYPGYGMMRPGMMGPGMMRHGMSRRMMMNWYMMPGHPGFQNYKSFLNQGRPIIEELNAKRAELRALYQTKNPNLNKVAKIAKEITRLEEKLQDIAFKYNLPDPCPWMWRGGGMMMRGNWW